MINRVSRRTRIAVAPVSPASGGTPRRPTGTSRSFAELLAEAETVGGPTASRYARSASTQAQGAPPGDWGMLARALPLQGMALRLPDREVKKSRPGEEPEG